MLSSSGRPSLSECRLRAMADLIGPVRGASPCDRWCGRTAGAGARTSPSVPVADLQVDRVGRARSGLDELLEAEQVRRPLRAAVVHELDRLGPAPMLEQHDGEVARLA